MAQLSRICLPGIAQHTIQLGTNQNRKQKAADYRAKIRPDDDSFWQQLKNAVDEQLAKL